LRPGGGAARRAGRLRAEKGPFDLWRVGGTGFFFRKGCGTSDSNTRWGTPGASRNAAFWRSHALPKVLVSGFPIPPHPPPQQPHRGERLRCRRHPAIPAGAAQSHPGPLTGSRRQQKLFLLAHSTTSAKLQPRIVLGERNFEQTRTFPVATYATAEAGRQRNCFQERHRTSEAHGVSASNEVESGPLGLGVVALQIYTCP